VSLRIRVSLLVATAVAFAVALVAGAAYWTVDHRLHVDLSDRLVNRAVSAANGPLGLPINMTQVSADQLLADDLDVCLLRSDGTYFLPPGGVVPPFGRTELAAASGRLAAGQVTLRSVMVKGQEIRIVAVPDPQQDGFALVASQSTKPLESTLHRLGLVLLLVGLIGIVAAAVVGLLVAQAGLRPVQRLRRAAERVALTGQVDPTTEPIPVHGEDEIARLAASFNAMLAALAGSQEQQRRLVADAGHELRTPLTSLRTNLDLLAPSEESRAVGGATLPPDEQRALLVDVRAQAEELTGLVGDLVELARQEEGAGAARVATPFDLVDTVVRAVTRVRRRAPSVRFETDLSPWTVVGDPALLERAVTNLLDNAAKWTRPDGRVWVSLEHGVLRVADEGPGISPEDLPHVFDRFYRATGDRATPGSGLGLAIVSQAAERHGGFVRASTAPSGGALLELRLPPADVATGEVLGSGSGSGLGPDRPDAVGPPATG
jgi:two-component system sensor histidine kinase MprB